jgi:hypothetical protein
MAARTRVAQLGATMWNILGGLLLIAIGILMQDSAFSGNFSAHQIVFDALGIFFIGFGMLQLWRRRRRANAASDDAR